MNFGEANHEQSYYYLKTPFSYEDNTSPHFPYMGLCSNMGFFHAQEWFLHPGGIQKYKGTHSAF